MAECGERVGKGTVTYPCVLTAAHDGPHQANENARSITERKMWEEDRPAWEAMEAARRNRESGLGEFQGPALTTAQGKTEGALPHPDVEKRRKQDEAERQAIAAHAQVDQVVVCPRCWDGDHSACVMIESSEAACRCFIDRPSLHGKWVEQPEIMCGFHHETHVPAEFGAECWIAVPGEDDHEHVHTSFRQREGDQRLPVASDMPVSHEEVRKDLLARLELGISRYGQPLQALNGRNSFLDAYEEALDLGVYLKTLQIERVHYAKKLREAHAHGTDEELGFVAEEVAAWLEQ